MGFSSSIDFRFASNTKDPLAVIQHLLNNGWTFNDSNSIWFLPLNDNNRFDWQKEPLHTWQEVVKIIEKKTNVNEIIGLVLTWQETQIGGDFLFFPDYKSLSINLNVNRQRLSSDLIVTDHNFYLQKLVPLLQSAGLTLEAIEFSDLF